VEIDAQTARPADDEPVRIRRHFMCFLGGDSTTIEDASVAGTATASSSGSVPPVLEPGLSFVRIPNSGSSAAEARTASHTNSVGSGAAAQLDPSLEGTVDPPAVELTGEIRGSGSSVPDASASMPVPDPLPPRPTTRSQHGIRQPKRYTDGTIRWGMSAAVTEEPSTVSEAL